MQIATWNVNSIRTRLDQVQAWLQDAQPDLLCLQETKVDDPLFPYEVFEAQGYQVHFHGQKAYNGVVIVSRQPLEDVRRGVEMFRQTEVPLLGLIENMKDFVCDDCGHQVALFGSGGGQRLATKFGIDLLGQLPLDPRIRQCADSGTPFVRQHPDSSPAESFRKIARVLLARLSSRDNPS